MAFYKIPAEKLQHLPLFGYDIIEQDDDYMLIEDDGGTHIIDKNSPWVWLEDPSDALQLDAAGMITSG